MQGDVATAAARDGKAPASPSEGLFGLGLFAPANADAPLLAPLPGEEQVLSGDRERTANPGRRRGRSVPSGRPHRGHPWGSRPADGSRDLAWTQTLARAAPRLGASGAPELPLRLDRTDLRAHRRRIRPGRLVLFTVDASGSMGGERIALARRAAVGLLRDAYLQRDQVALIAFAGRDAPLLLRPTAQAELVRRAVAGLPCGGTTPLASALQRSLDTLAADGRRDDGRRRLLVLITDGRGNVGSHPGHEAMLAEQEAAARALTTVPRLRIVLLDATDAARDDRPAINLAALLAAQRVRLRDLGDEPHAELLTRLG